MEQLVIDMSADLNALSVDELIALNQKLGQDVDAIRDYRRTVKEAYSAKIHAANALAKLSPDERAALGLQQSVEVKPETLSVNVGGGE